MKKVLLMTLVLSLLISTVAFAAPSVGYVFSVYENGNVFYYMFGSTEKDIDEVGVTIQGKDYNLDENALAKAKESGKFGIGIADPKNVLKDSFEATPYNVIGESRNDGTVKTVVKNEVPDNDVIALNSLTIDGKAVAGFYTGTTETDFYYGLDEINSASDIPEVSYTLSIGNATTSLTEETGGYVYTITASKEGRDGVEKNAQFKVHFREFAEVTKTVYPDVAYTVQHSYIGARNVLSTFHNQNGKTVALTVRSIPDIYSSNNSYLQYITYDVPVENGYAPVYYDLKNVWLGNSGQNDGDPFYVSAYSYDGSLNSSDLPETTDDSENIFKGFNGFNADSSFLLGTFTGAKPKYSGTLLSSTSVKEGANIIIWKSDDITIDNDGKAKNTYRINYHSGYAENADGWEMPIVVKYVEKNPKDVTDVYTTIESLKINGKDADAVKDNTYYVGVTDLTTNDGITKDSITVTPTVTGATYEVSEIENNQATITVTAKDGETTGTYYVKFKGITTATIPATTPYTQLQYNGSSYVLSTQSQLKVKRTAEGMTGSDTRVQYVKFNTNSIGNIVLFGTSTFACTPERNATYVLYNTVYDTITANCTFDEFDNSADNQLCSMTVANYGDYTPNNVAQLSIDSNSLDIKPDGNIIIAIAKGDVSSSVAQFVAGSAISLTINYITLD